MTSFDKTKLHGAILGMCNPLLDISAEVPTELLEKYGVSLNNAILAEEKHIPLYQDLIDNYPVQYIAGGATQNSIRVALWMLQVPGSTSYFGAIGNDKYGETLERCAHEDGVNVLYQKHSEVPTGTCAVLVHGGERSLVANLAAANTFTATHLDLPESKEAIQAAQIVYISGFFLTVSVDAILSLATHCVDNSKIFSMNLSAPFLIQFFGDQMAAVMPYTDFVFANESEAAAYGEAKGYGQDLNTIALKLAAQPKASGTRARVVVFTQGASATIVACNGVVTTFPVDALPKDKLVDTNGAGDAFVGGFLSQLVQDKPLSECVRAGHFASREIIQRSGCTFPKECAFY
jgi:adenosine kinase